MHISKLGKIITIKINHYFDMKNIITLFIILFLVAVNGQVFGKDPKKAEKREWKKKKKHMTGEQLKDLIEENHRLKTKDQALTQKAIQQDGKTQELSKLQQEHDALMSQLGALVNVITPSDSSKIITALNQMLKTTKQQKNPKVYNDLMQKLGVLANVTTNDPSVMMAAIDKVLKSAKMQKNPKVYNDLMQKLGVLANVTSGSPSKLVDELAQMIKNAQSQEGDGEDFQQGIVFRVQIGAYVKRDLSNILADHKEKFEKYSLEQEKRKEVNHYTIGNFRDYWKANELKKQVQAMVVHDAWIVPIKDGQRVPLKTVLSSIKK